MSDHLAKVVKGGDRLAALEALRDRLAQELDDCTYGRDVAVLATRLQAVLLEIDEFPPRGSTSKADQIAQRRAARRGDSG